MNERLQHAIAGGLDNVFSQLDGLMVEGGVAEGTEPSMQVLCSSIDMEGECGGRMFLRTTDALCRQVLRLLLPAERATDEILQDVVCEVLNMVAASAATLVHQAGGDLTVGVPLIEPLPLDPEEGTEAVCHECMGQQILVWTVPTSKL